MIFDANALYGFDNKANVDLSPERTFRFMDQKNIDAAIFTNLKCKYYDFEEGNRETFELVNANPGRVYGYAAFHQSQYLLVEKDLERCYHEYKLTGVRFFNTMTGFVSGWGGGLTSLFMKRMCRLFETWRWPLFIEGGFPFDQIAGIAAQFPLLPIIASGVGYGNMSEAICAAQECRNIFLEISTLDTMDGVRILVQEIGDEQIVFGTGMPYNAPSSEILMVTTADIPEESKKRIFSENLYNLVQGGTSPC